MYVGLNHNVSSFDVHNLIEHVDRDKWTRMSTYLQDAQKSGKQIFMYIPFVNKLYEVMREVHYKSKASNIIHICHTFIFHAQKLAFAAPLAQFIDISNYNID